MTRIETALQRMRDEAQVMVWHGDLTKMAATPIGQAIGALVEAAEAWYAVDYGDPGELLADADLRDALLAFRAATEPQTAGGER